MDEQSRQFMIETPEEREAFDKIIRSKVSPSHREIIILVVDHNGKQKHLAEMIAQRAYTIDGVMNVRVSGPI